MTGYISQYRDKKILEFDPERAMLHFDSTIADYQQGAGGVMEWGGVVANGTMCARHCPLSMYTSKYKDVVIIYIH